MTERIVHANGAELCTESFGDPASPPILLIMGVGASMMWCDERLCRMLAGRGRFVIRYDHRDTGRSTGYPVGSPGYTGMDLLTDALGVLDAYDISAAHLVGVSAGGAFAQLLALDYPERVLSLVLISTSPASPGDRGLPPPTDELLRFLTTAEVDWDDRESVIGYQVAYARVLAGSERPFDETAARAFARRDVERARDFAAGQNHTAIEEAGSDRALSSITVPALVIHGTADPMFPLEHGRALAEEIPTATVLTIRGAGHGIDPADRETLATAIVDHTASGVPA